MGCSIRGRCWQDGKEHVAEIPSLRLTGNGQTMSDSLTSLKTAIETLSGNQVDIQLIEGNCFEVTSEDPEEFEDFLIKRLHKSWQK